jgi:predicted GNAT family acetyltransferase
MSAFQDHAAENRYELEHPGGPSFARYHDGAGSRAILYVETPYEARGQGHAERLMAAIVSDARMRGTKLTPVCGYAVAYFRRHRDAGDVLA